MQLLQMLECMKHFLTVTNMTNVWNFEIMFDKWQAVGICDSSNYAGR